MVAAARNQVQMIETLTKYGADLTLKARNGQTALDLARVAEASDAVSYLQSIQGLVRIVLFISETSRIGY